MNKANISWISSLIISVIFVSACTVFDTQEQAITTPDCTITAKMDTAFWNFDTVYNAYYTDSTLSINGIAYRNLIQFGMSHYSNSISINLDKRELDSYLNNGVALISNISDAQFNKLMMASNVSDSTYVDRYVMPTKIIETEGDVFFATHELTNSQNFSIYLAMDTLNGTLTGRFDLDFEVVRRSTPLRYLDDSVQVRDFTFNLKLVPWTRTSNDESSICS